MNDKLPRRADTPANATPDDVEIHVLGNEVFQRTLEDVIRTSRENQRAIFLSGTYGRKTPYFVLCLTSDMREHILAAQDLIEHLLCAPNAVLDTPSRIRAEARLRARLAKAQGYRDPSLN